MKKIIITLAVFTSLGLYAQNNVGIGTSTPNSQAILEIESEDKGILISRLTTIARNALGGALTGNEDGMLVYDKDLTAFYYWDGPNLQWVQVGGGTNTDNQTLTLTGNTLSISGGNNVTLIDNVDDADNDPTNEIELPLTAITGQVLSWDGTSWIAQNSASGADNWGSQTVVTNGTNISGDGTTGSPITVTDGDSDATNEIELPTGGTNGQVLTTDGNGTYTWTTDNGGTDDQNIANLAFNNATNILTVGIENGTSQTIDLSNLVNDADSDITNEIQDLSINTTTNILTITNNGSATSIDLSSYLDNTDNQDLSLTGNTLSLTNDGTTVDLSGYLDNTDNQNISGSSFTTTTGNLVIGIQNGTNQTVNLNGLKDHDWYEVGTTRGADNINDNIFTQGNVGIGIAVPVTNLHIKSSNPNYGAIMIGTNGASANTHLTHETNGDFIVWNGTYGAGVKLMTIKPNGRLISHLTSVSDNLKPSGWGGGLESNWDIWARASIGGGVSGTAPTWNVSNAGVAQKPGGGTWGATSDRRTKKEINNFTDGLNVLTEINPVTFKYNGLYDTPNDKKVYVGIIAQEVKKVAPYMIGSYEAPRTLDSEIKEEILNYDGGTYMIYVLVNSVKELTKIVESQQKEIDRIKGY